MADGESGTTAGENWHAPAIGAVAAAFSVALAAAPFVQNFLWRVRLDSNAPVWFMFWAGVIVVALAVAFLVRAIAHKGPPSGLARPVRLGFVALAGHLVFLGILVATPLSVGSPRL